MGQIIHPTPISYGDIDLSWMVGRLISSVSFHDPLPWVFSLGTGAAISVECLWRIIERGRIVLCSDDHRHKFRLPAPVDGVARARQLLAGPIKSARLREATADLTIEFEGDRSLEIIPCLNRPWHLYNSVKIADRALPVSEIINDDVCVLGSAHAIVECSSGSWRVIAIEAGDLPLAKEAASILEKAYVAVAEYAPRGKAIGTLIVGNEHAAIDARLSHYSRSPFARVVIGPYVEGSPSLHQRLTALAVKTWLDTIEGVSIRRQAAVSFLIGDSLQGHLFSIPERLSCGQAMREAARIVSQSYASSDSSAAGPGEAEEAFSGVLVDAVLLRRAAGEFYQKSSGSVLSQHIIRDIASSRTNAFVFRTQVTPADLLTYVKEDTVVTAHCPAPTTSGASVAIECAAELVGYLEECGCKGVERGGGLKRLVSRWRDAGEEEKDSLRLVLGNMLSTPTLSGYNAKANSLILRALGSCGIHAYVPSCTELLAIGSGLTSRDDWGNLPLTACNITAASDRSNFPAIQPFVNCTIDEKTIRVIGIVDLVFRLIDRRQREIIEREFTIVPPAAAVPQLVTTAPAGAGVIVCGAFDPIVLKPITQGLDSAVLVIDADNLFPRLAHDHLVPTQSSGLWGRHPVVFGDGIGYGLLSLQWQPRQGRVEFRTVVLRHDVPATDSIAQEVMDVLGEDSQVELNFEEPLLSVGREYVGSRRCLTCHERQCERWADSPHGQAMATLQRVQRHRVCNCVACHVVGYGLPTGFDFGRPEARLENVGCEVCHGPGSTHVVSSAKRDVRRAPGSQVCVSCHNLKHSSFALCDNHHIVMQRAAQQCCGTVK